VRGTGPAWQVAGWDVLILEEWAKAQNEFAVPPAAAAALPAPLHAMLHAHDHHTAHSLAAMGAAARPYECAAIHSVRTNRRCSERIGSGWFARPSRADAVEDGRTVRLGRC
jgi:hypothetical protein